MNRHEVFKDFLDRGAEDDPKMYDTNLTPDELDHILEKHLEWIDEAEDSKDG